MHAVHRRTEVYPVAVLDRLAALWGLRPCKIIGRWFKIRFQIPCTEFNGIYFGLEAVPSLVIFEAKLYTMWLHGPLMSVGRQVSEVDSDGDLGPASSRNPFEKGGGR